MQELPAKTNKILVLLVERAYRLYRRNLLNNLSLLLVREQIRYLAIVEDIADLFDH